MTDRWETEVTAALAAAADEMELEPDALVRIQARTRRRWRWVRPVAAMAATVAVFAGVAGVVAGGRDDPRGRQPASGVTTAPRTTSVALVYYVGTVVGDDSEESVRLFAEPRDLPSGPTRLVAALSAMLAAPDDPDYRTPWPAGTVVRSARDDDGVVTVDLTKPALWIRQADVVLGVRQLQYTAAAVTGRRQLTLRLFVDGVPVTALSRVKISKFADLVTGSRSDVLASAQVVSPSEGTVVAAGRMTVTGEVAGGEVRFLIIHNGQKQRLVALRGQPVVPEYRPAPSGVPGRRTWVLTLDALPGAYQVLVWSPRNDGTDSRSFTVP